MGLFKVIFDCFLYFSVSYIILSLPFNNAPLFLYLYSWTSPYTERIFFEEQEEKGKPNKKQSRIKSSLGKPLVESSNIAKRFFTNTLPSSDSIKEKIVVDDYHEESYTVEEKQFLEKILQKNK